MTRVLFITRVIHGYRVPFHQRVRTLLEDRGISYEIVHGGAEEEHLLKQDVASLPWAREVKTHHLRMGSRCVLWQPLTAAARDCDLVIVGQENKYLLNYVLQLGRNSIFPKVALWGHGRNFQARDPDSLAERWKRFWATRCDWWFAYTDDTRKHLLKLGFPAERITVFNNAIDTGALRDMAAGISESDIAAAREKYGIGPGPIGIFVGGLYPDKRLEFLVEAAERVREAVPDFKLVVVGGGTDRARIERWLSARPWLTVTGPLFGKDKATLMRAAELFLMPGLVGLAVLDAAATSLPVVTTAYPYHSPEIAYLKDGTNGVMVADWEDPLAYAAAVTDLLGNADLRLRMAQSALATSFEHSIEAMADRFAAGVVSALGEKALCRNDA